MRESISQEWFNSVKAGDRSGWWAGEKQQYGPRHPQRASRANFLQITWEAGKKDADWDEPLGHLPAETVRLSGI